VLHLVQHFIFFVQEFNLIKKQELQPLAELIASLTKTSKKEGKKAKDRDRDREAKDDEESKE
jgi:hypothetical protein